MAMLTCPECKGKISDKAASCPNCGCVIRKKRRGCMVFIVLLMLFSVGMCYFFYEQPASKPGQTKQPDKIAPEGPTKQDQIERMLLASGEVFPLRCYIQDNMMNNPKSYEHVQTTFIDKGDFLLVETTFRGTNKFGAVVRNKVVANVSLKGDVLKIISAE